MCMKYEKEYGECFDLLIHGLFWDDGIIELFENWNIKVNDEDKFKDALLELLEKMHEDGIIEPNEQN